MGERTRDSVKDVILSTLGYPAVDVELDNSQLETAIDLAIDNYRMKSSNATEEAFLELKLLRNDSVYSLPREVENVFKIYRSGNGIIGGTGSNIDPFALSYSNSYLLSAVRGSMGGGLLTYELYYQFDQTAGKLFGREITFTFNTYTKQLKLERLIAEEEAVLLHVYQRKPEIALLNETMIYPWIRDWAIAESMEMLGRIRGKFSSIPGVKGAITLDGQSLLQSSKDMKEQLLKTIRNYGDGSVPLGFLMG